MNLTPVTDSGHLYSASNVFPPHLAQRVATVDWDLAAYNKLQIGNSLRRQLHYIPARDSEFDNHIRNTIAPQIQQQCGIEFTDPTQLSHDWWLDEPGFRPMMHTDGDKPSALQIYWQPTDLTDLGTAFYSTNNTEDLTHYFANLPNTGYLMLNSHKPRPVMWHDMLCSVPEDVLRLCLYVSFGPYIKR